MSANMPRRMNAQAAAIAEQEEREAREFAAGLQRLDDQHGRAHGHGDGDGDDDSDSSHSSHSSYAERHGMAGVRPPAAILPPLSRVVGTLLFLFAIQLTGLYLFTKGFLLTRIELDGVSTCDPGIPQHIDGQSLECTLPARYNRSLIFIIDALRYDFVAPAPPSDQIGAEHWPYDHRMHGIVPTVERLVKQQADDTLLVHFAADPPTTTLQRLKALMTGVLPTFVDAGSNFGASEIGEDNLLAQMRSKLLREAGINESQSAPAHVGMGFMGDDTWMGVYPRHFDTDWQWPFDSFNVEDLDTVDTGVKQHLDAFLGSDDPSLKDWRLLVAHNLGLDHAGHRFGPSHAELTRKLRELEERLVYILERIPDDALFVLMGDHGMDAHGDHGGDGELETGAALLMHARYGLRAPVRSSQDASQRFLQRRHLAAASGEPSFRTFRPLTSPAAETANAAPLHRSITQIDFVPTFALLHGLPIPFNSLGSVIPELFPGDLLLRALRINSHQIQRYLRSYEAKSPDFLRFRDELDRAWSAAIEADRAAKASPKNATLEDEAIEAYYVFNRFALSRAREVWARFDFALMGAGLVVLISSIVAALRVLASLKSTRSKSDTSTSHAARLEDAGNHVRSAALTGLVVGAPAAAVSAVALVAAHRSSVVSADLRIYGLPLALATVATVAAVAAALQPHRSDRSAFRVGAAGATMSAMILLHAAAMGSNSFLIWEQRAVVAFLQLLLLLRGIKGLRSKSTVGRVKIAVLIAISMLAVRAMGGIRVCREEQGPSCETTFYAKGLTTSSIGDSPSLSHASSTTINTLQSSLLAYACAYAMPRAVDIHLNVMQSNTKLIRLFLTWIVRPSLMMGSGYWLLDTLLTQSWLHNNDARMLGLIAWGKMALARSTLCFLLCCIIIVWPSSPLPLELTVEQGNQPPAPGHSTAGPKQRASIAGLRNVLGSSYLVLLLFVFGLQHLIAQPMGQVALALAMLVILCLAELGTTEQLTMRSDESNGAGTASALPRAPPASPAGPVEVLTLALLGHAAFFSTGHQATVPSIQWRTAFIGFRQVTQPFSALLVALNSFGPLTILPALAIPLLVMWQQAPQPRGTTSPPMPTMNHLLRASLLLVIWQSCITLASCIFAAHFRRHLMLFKIWAPRFMLASVGLVGVHIALVLGLLAAGIIMSKTAQTLGTDFATVTAPAEKAVPRQK